MNQFFSPRSFEQPLWLVDSTWIEHGPFGLWIADRLRPRLTVELGSYRGYSFSVFCQALAQYPEPWNAVAIDSWEGDTHSGFFKDKGNEFFVALGDHARLNYAPHVELKRMYFSQALSSIPDASIDLLHIDGRHTYDDVKEDHTRWISKLSDRAIVMFHDTQVREQDFGVWRYWAEISQGRPSFEFHHGHGLGILAHGPIADTVVAELLSPDLEETTRQQVRDAYHRLGEGVGALHKVRKYDAAKASLHPIRKSLRRITGR